MKTGTPVMGLINIARRSARELGLGALVLLGCFGVAPTPAKADISWTFNNVDFYIGSWSATGGQLGTGGTVYTEVATLSGSFSTNEAVTTVTDFSKLTIAPTQPSNDKYAFTVAGMVDDYLPGTIGIYAAGWSSYIDLILTSPLKSAGGSYSFSSGYDCPGCAVLSPDNEASVGSAQVVTGTVTQATPEPGFYAVLAIGLSGLLFGAWRRRRA